MEKQGGLCLRSCWCETRDGHLVPGELSLPGRQTAELLGSKGWNFSAGGPLGSVTWLTVNHVSGKTWSQEKGGNRVIWGAANNTHHSSRPEWILKKQENKCFLWNQRMWGLNNPRKWGTPIPFSRWQNRSSNLKSLTQVAPVSPPHYVVHESRTLPVLITAEPQKGPGI